MEQVRAWLRGQSLAQRLAVAFGVLLVVLFGLSSDDHPPPGDVRSFDVWAAAILGAACLIVLLLRRRFPGLVVVTVTALTTGWYFAGYTSGVINIAPLVAFYELGATGDRRRQIGIGALALSIPLVTILVFAPDQRRESLNAVGWPLAAMLAGEITRSRRLLLSEYAQKAAASEAEREAEAERRVAEERLRIARDVHDVLAHAVAVMTVQAGVAADAQERDPEAVKAALATIRSAGKEAMAEMRATVAVLRGGAQATTAPAPRLDRLGELIDGARAKGLEVDLVVQPDAPEQLDGIESVVQLTAYRVVQESLTNVLRHAAASRATVTLDHKPTELVVTVEDNGRIRPLLPFGPLARAVGFGLRGMRERVESLGGVLRYGPRTSGGWKVVATLPVREA
jgi:signal transduction histidine kinase